MSRPLRETEDTATWRGQLRAIGTLLPLLWPRERKGLRTRVLVAAGLLIAAKLTNVYVPFFYKDVVDALAPGDDKLLLIPVALIAGYGLARIGALAFGELRDIIFINVAQHAIRVAALSTFRHLHRLSLRFHLDRQMGGLSRSIERGTKAIQFLLEYLAFHILPTLFEIGLVCTILLINYDWWIAAITFTTVVSYITFTLLVTEWRGKFRREMNVTDNEAMTKAVDSLLNYETVKYFSNEEHEARRFDKSLGRYEKAAVKSASTLSLLEIGQNATIGLGLIAVMLIAAKGVVNGSMTVGDLVLVNTFLIQLYQPLGFLGFVYRQIKQSLIDMEKMFELTDIEAEVSDPPGAPALAIPQGEVVFDRVSFGYDPRRQILFDVSFRVPPGHTVAIAGPSGAGKSTISRLLFRFYDVTGGAIRIDGQDIRAITQDSLRRSIGIVPQDTVLFNDTVLYNIRYGRPDATDEEVFEAARLARIHEFVLAMPDGYKTVVGERGLKLSGGEKQRVAIARTILKGSRIMLFDEATSALDSKTEREIQASLREVSANRTTLMIAHRLSTIIHADEILVLDKGRIVERGRHGDLLAQGGQYAAMWARQQEAAVHEEALFSALVDGVAKVKPELVPAGE